MANEVDGAEKAEEEGSVESGESEGDEASTSPSNPAFIPTPFKVRRESEQGERIVKLLRRLEKISYKCILFSVFITLGIWPLVWLVGGTEGLAMIFGLPFAALVICSALGALLYLLRTLVICIYFVQVSLSQIYLIFLALVGFVMLMGVLEGIWLGLTIVGFVATILYVSAEVREQDPTIGGQPPVFVRRVFSQKRMRERELFKEENSK